jgi:putative multiple sugar transport system substrate-binding protein
VKKFTKLFAIMMAVFMLATVTVGCGSDKDEKGDKTSSKKIQVGIVLPTKDEPRWVQDEKRFGDALKEAGYTSEVLFSQGDSAKEKSNVEALIAKGIEVLIICPQDGAAAAATVEAAAAEGIKVIAYDRLITGTDKVDYYVSFDSISVGKAQAQYLVDKASGTKGQPLYLYAGAASDNNAFLFFQGAWEVLQPKVADGTFKIANSAEAVKLQAKKELTRDEMGKIIGQVTTDWDFNKAKSVAESNLTAAAADMKGEVLVLAPNDGTARSIADTFKGDSAISKFTVTGQDAEQASVQYVIDGLQSMTVFKDVRTLVADAISMAKSILSEEEVDATAKTNNGKTDVPTKQTEVITVDQANVKSALIDSKYYKAEDFKNLK